jgi:hypothetical protein
MGGVEEPGGDTTGALISGLGTLSNRDTGMAGEYHRDGL